MFTFEIERKPVFFLCKLVFGGRKKVFFLCDKQCGCGSQALFVFRTSVVRVSHKRCSYSVQAFCELKGSLSCMFPVCLCSFEHIYSCLFVCFVFLAFGAC